MQPGRPDGRAEAAQRAPWWGALALGSLPTNLQPEPELGKSGGPGVQASPVGGLV